MDYCKNEREKSKKYGPENSSCLKLFTIFWNARNKKIHGTGERQVVGSCEDCSNFLPCPEFEKLQVLS